MPFVKKKRIKILQDFLQFESICCGKPLPEGRGAGMNAQLIRKSVTVNTG